LALKAPTDSSGVFSSTKPDPVVGEIFIRGNKLASSLPENVNKLFPNLLGYSVTSCRVREISRENFEGLVKLRGIYLWGNQIERISSDTFDGLMSLEVLNLGRNENSSR
jgi:Leucine-rich repeat (LRR) protein